MKIINILHHSISSAIGDPVRSGSFEHYYAIELKRRYPEVEYECWRPQRLLRKPVVYSDCHGITHRVFPSYYLCTNVEYSPQLHRALKQHVADGTVGVIFHGAYNIHMCVLARAIVRYPSIVQSHGGFPAQIMKARSRKKLLKSLYLILRACERRAFPLFRHLFAISSEEKAHLETRYGLKNVMWSPVGLDFDRFQPRDRSSVRRRLQIAGESRIVLYVGRLAKEKGLYTLIDAFGSVHAANTSTILWLVGSGPIERDLRRYSANLGIPVQFVGPIAHAQLSDWYSASDVVVAPSPIEWFGMSIAEALACGAPVVACRAGGAIDNVEAFDSGLLVAPDDSQALAWAIRQTLDKGQPLPNREKARRRISWDAKAPLVMELLFGTPATGAASQACANSSYPPS